MTKYEKLQVIERAYHMLIPCIKNNAVQDYGLILVEAPNCLNELLESEKPDQEVKQAK